MIQKNKLSMFQSTNQPIYSQRCSHETTFRKLHLDDCYEKIMKNIRQPMFFKNNLGIA